MRHLVGHLDVIYIGIIIWVFSFLCIYHIVKNSFYFFSRLLITSFINFIWRFSDGCLFCMLFLHQVFLWTSGNLINIIKLIWLWIKVLQTKKITQEPSHYLVCFIDKSMKRFPNVINNFALGTRCILKRIFRPIIHINCTLIIIWKMISSWCPMVTL